jgi:transposase-like protein
MPILELHLFDGHIIVLNQGGQNDQEAKSFFTQFRQQMVELHLAGRSLNDLAHEFGCGASTISAWVTQAKLKTEVPLPSGRINEAERLELAQLRKPVK